jgi:hypothetical protein
MTYSELLADEEGFIAPASIVRASITPIKVASPSCGIEAWDPTIIPRSIATSLIPRRI